LFEPGNVPLRLTQLREAALHLRPFGLEKALVRLHDLEQLLLVARELLVEVGAE
jgi:hypothetical protein